jgi:hypothetical protein
MIDELFIIQRDSGLTLFHLNLKLGDESEVMDSDLLGGALQAVRLLMKECKIGELNEFTTHEHRIEMRCDLDIVAVLIADLHDPPHEVLDLMTEDILVLFVNTYREEINNFAGNVRCFFDFKETVEEYVKLQGEVQKESTKKETEKIKESHKHSSTKITSTGGLDSEINLSGLIDWLKNHYNPNADIKADVKVICPPDKSIIPTSLLLDGGPRKLSRLDQWMSAHIGKPNYREIILVIGLNPTHGPAIIQSILTKIQNLGDPAFNEDKEIFQWLPTEVVFVGPAIQRSTFDGLKKIVKEYKNSIIIVPNYADHIHREHTPHHAFYRCKITGWKWKIGNVTSENFPQQVYPKPE